MWGTVERVVKPADTPQLGPPIPKTTKRRWCARATSTARALVVVLAASAKPELEAMAGHAGLDASRATLIDVFAGSRGVRPGARLAPLAALAQMLERGIRLL
jgi:hypothetical protein